MDFVTHNVNETEELGASLAKKLYPGCIIAFSGDLGAGKTAFIRGLARGLSIYEPVTSPTFTIVNEYLTGLMPLFHFDLYRLSCEDDLFDIGWDEYVDRKGVCAVEWSERAPDLFHDAVKVSIKNGTNDEDRVIKIEGIQI